MNTSTRDAIASPVAGLTIYNTSTNALEFWNGTGWVSTIYTPPAPATHTIGESYGGGKVFYVYDNGQHGLIAITQLVEIGWNNNTLNPNTMALANGIGSGKANTVLIIAIQGNSNYAARFCNEYAVTVGGVTYGDWYLPSKFELNLAYLQRAAIGIPYPGKPYWSSTELDLNNAWTQDFSTGQQVQKVKGGLQWAFPIRAF